MTMTVESRQSCNSFDLNISNASEMKYDNSNRISRIPRTNTIIVCLKNNNQHSTSIDNNFRSCGFTQNNRCSLRFYSDVNECVKDLKYAPSREYIIVVLMSYPIKTMQEIIYCLRRYRIGQTIFIVSSKRNAKDFFPSSNDNISIFPDKNSMFRDLKVLIDDIQKGNFEGCLFTNFSRTEKTLQDVHQERGAHVWNHIFKILLAKMPCKRFGAKKQMLTECRAFYRNDPVQLKRIEEFKKTYKPCDAIRWYTKPGFLFDLVNKALRSGDALALYTFRYFIIDLYKRFKEIQNIHSNTSIRLYRGARIHLNEVKNLRVGSLVTTNSFLSCSLDSAVAKSFCSIDPETGKTPSRSRKEKRQFVFYIIDVDLEKFPDTELANVSGYTDYPQEKEMIFMLGSIFTINNKIYRPKERLWVIKMSSSSDKTQSGRKYEPYIHRRLRDTDAVMLFGHALVSIKGDYMHSKDYFENLLKTLPINHPARPVIYYDLGRIYRSLEEYKTALDYFQKAKRLLRQLLPKRMFDYCRALGGSGSVHSRLGHWKRAINILEKIINVYRKFLPYDHTETPFDLNRLGYAYYNAKRYEDALSTLYKADEFFQNRMTIDHQGHAETFFILGLVYRALGNQEESYKFFMNTLHKRHQLLAKDHPDIASTYYQLSLIHEERGEYKIAFEYAKKSLDIRFFKLPPSHSKLKDSNTLVKRLKKNRFAIEGA